MLPPVILRTHVKQHLVLALPIIISQLSHIAVAVSDNVMVGWLGAESLAACALVNSILWSPFAMGLGLSYGMTPLVAAADARKNYKKTTKVLKHSLVINLIFALALCAIVLLSTPLLYHIGQTATVVDLAAPYLRLVIVSLIPFMLFQTFREYAEALSLTKEAMYINVGCSLVNVVLNYLLIYGKLGFPAMGLNGAGWATLVSRTFMAIVIVGYVFWSPQLRQRIVAFRLKGFSWLYFVKIIQIGLPAGLEFTLDSVAYTVTMIMAGWVSVETQAAHIIAANLTSVSSVAVWGIALATTIRVGNQFGLRDFATLRTVGFVGFGLGGILALVASLIFVLGHTTLPACYTDESVVLCVAATLMTVVSIQQLPNSVDAVGVCALRGTEDTVVPFVITTISRWLIGIPLAYLLCFSLNWGVIGLWWGLLAARFLAAIIMFWRFDWKSKRLATSA